MMRKFASLPFLFLHFLVGAMLVSAPALVRAGTESTLHSFNADARGQYPGGGLISDSAGNLYGVASGGTYDAGLVFELVPNSNGGWEQKTIYNFLGGNDGDGPTGPLAFDAAGNLYGATAYGGGSVNCLYGGCGTVFEMKPNADGSWTESVLDTFDWGTDGAYPNGGLVFDSAGNIYGTTGTGGKDEYYGVVFELSPTPSGPWNKTILYSFQGAPEFDGDTPGSLLMDAAGNLYGVTVYGGKCVGTGSCGTVFELSKGSGGQWKEKIIYDFAGNYEGRTDGEFPHASLIADEAGNLYGTTFSGGTGTGTGCSYAGCGTVYELSLAAGGQWTEKVLYSFKGTADGNDPETPVMFDAAGNLYGTTASGGAMGNCSYGGCGTAFELTPNGSGQWSEHVLFRFRGVGEGYTPSSSLFQSASGQLLGETFYGRNAGEIGTVYSLKPGGSHWNVSVVSHFVNGDGDYPTVGLLADAAGNLYGTTAQGGATGQAAVFQLIPASGGGWNEKLIYSFATGDATGRLGTDTAPSRLIKDALGNLYGETQRGGQFDAGMVYELSPAEGGAWTETTLYSFPGGVDGSVPAGGLKVDQAGNFYGTTRFGGNSSVQGQVQSGYGTVFELVPGNVWSARVLYQFAGYPGDGAEPQAGVILDHAGNLYGTTTQGGAGTCKDLNGVSGCGTAFQLTPAAGLWKETILHTFLGLQQDGGSPDSGLVFDNAGNLFGTTPVGNPGGPCVGLCGTVFELSPAGDGTWSESFLFIFPDENGQGEPKGGVTFDGAGNLFGTTYYGANTGGQDGSVFELSPSSGGGWNYTSLYVFTDANGDGGAPRDGVILGPQGVLYGTTINGGRTNTGAVFEIKR